MGCGGSGWVRLGTPFPIFTSLEIRNPILWLFIPKKKSFAYKLVIRIYKIKPLVSIIFVKH